LEWLAGGFHLIASRICLKTAAIFSDVCGFSPPSFGKTFWSGSFVVTRFSFKAFVKGAFNTGAFILAVPLVVPSAVSVWLPSGS
jgi:hypothetical protein